MAQLHTPLNFLSSVPFSTYHREKDRSWTYIYIYINKGFNFNMNVIHSAPTNQSHSLGYNHLVFVNHKLKHFSIDHIQTFCNISILWYKKFIEKSLNLRKFVPATRVRSLTGSQNLILLANVLTTNKSRVPNLLSFTIVVVKQKWKIDN